MTRPVHTDDAATSLGVQAVAIGGVYLGQPMSKVAAWFVWGAVLGTPLVVLGYLGFGIIGGTVLLFPLILVSGVVALPLTVVTGKAFDHNRTLAYWRSVLRAELHGPRPVTPLDIFRALDPKVLPREEPS